MAQCHPQVSKPPSISLAQCRSWERRLTTYNITISYTLFLSVNLINPKVKCNENKKAMGVSQNKVPINPLVMHNFPLKKWSELQISRQTHMVCALIISLRYTSNPKPCNICGHHFHFAVLKPTQVPENHSGSFVAVTMQQSQACLSTEIAHVTFSDRFERNITIKQSMTNHPLAPHNNTHPVTSARGRCFLRRFRRQ